MAIDTATPAVTAGVFELRTGAEPVVLAERVTVDAKAHTELLTTHITGALADAGLPMRDVDAIVCGAGPGPFTGLRVGMVTAAALGHALGIPVHGVCSLDAVLPRAGVPEVWGAGDAGVRQAYVPGMPGAGVPHLVVTDARRREVYWAAYDAAHRRTDGPHVERPADLAARLGELRVGCAAGAGARMYADVIGLPVVEPDYPTVIGLATAAATMLPGAPAPFVPMYLRRPDVAEPGPRKPVLAAREATP
jgi:tRNA threonylcarbamoyl adenosine modification protein YeaZ